MPLETRQIPGRYERALTLDRAAINEETRTVNIAVSSEEPYMRWFGLETLGHDAKEVDLSFMKDGAPLLMDHNTRDQIGVIESVSLGSDKVLRAVARFGRSARASEVFQDVVDGIRSKISVGYEVMKYETTKGGKDGPDQVRATKWRPLEASFVAVPADPTVGVGRSLDSDESIPNPTPAEPAATPEGRSMPEVPTVVAPQAASEPTTPNIVEMRTRAFQEVSQALELGRTLGLEKEAQGLVSAGKSTQEINAELMKLNREKAPKPINNPLAEAGLTEKEAKEYSYSRAVFAALEETENRDSGKYGFEREVSKALLRMFPADFKTHGGIVVPFTRTGLDSATSTAGAELKFTKPAEFIELLRNASAAIRLGVRVLNGLGSPLAFPKQTAGSALSWIANENPGSDVSESDAAFTTVTLSPKTGQSTTSFSRQLQILGDWDAEQIIRRDLAKAWALGVDRAVFHGTGSSGQPKGVYKTTSINTKAMGGAVAFGELIDMVTETAIDNALLSSTGFVTNPAMAGKLMQTLEFSASGAKAIWTGNHCDGNIAGYRAIATNQISSVMTGTDATGGAEYGIIFGSWDEFILGQFGPGLEIIIDPLRLKKQGMIELTSFGMVGTAVTHEQAFCAATGATLA